MPAKKTISNIHSITIFLIMFVLTFSTIGVTPAYAATLVVTTSANVGPGSLRQAIADAPNGSTITFNSSLSSTTIYLASPLQIDKQLTINGSSLASRITISGDSDANGSGNVQVFYLIPGAIVTLDSLIITKGWSNTVGGGITSLGSQLTLKNSALIDNYAINFGGGIYNQAGSMLLMNSTISGNSSDLYSGGGIFNADGMVSISNCTISDNFSAGGGGVSNDSIMEITDSTLSDNIALLDGGGGINNAGTLTVTNSTISGNSANHGGGIHTTGAGVLLTVTNSTLSGNYALTNGGGILSAFGTANIDNSILKNNVAIEGGGGIYNAATLTVTNSTLSGNTADNGAGIYNYKSLAITNSTISGNQANTNGGGIYNITSTGAVNVYNSSIVFNVTDADADINGGMGGGVYNHVNLAVFNLRNSLVAGNSVSGAPVYDECNGTLRSYGRNLVGALLTTTRSGCIVTTSSGSWTKLNNLSLLGPLQNNGGLTPSIALLSGSNAIDGGDPTLGCINSIGFTLPSDQRGISRPQGANCDIGAFEFDSTSSGSTIIDVKIAGTSRGTYPMTPDNSQKLQYLLDGGPVEISSNNGVGIIASLNQWRRPTPYGGWTGVAQSMALPVSQISNRYVIPRYNGTDPTLYNAVLMANVDTVPRTITVTIGGVEMGSYLLGPSDSRFEVYNVTGGPLVVSSVAGSKIVASLYELKRAGSTGEYNGQSEMMGLPATQLSDKMLIPIYFGMWGGYLDASLYFANADTFATTVDVTIGGVSRGTYVMQPNTSMVVKYLLDGGPVEISSNNGAKIVASLNQWRRPSPVGGWTGVAQSMALPMEKISNSYVIPRYNGTDPSLYNAVLMANVDSVPRTITVEIGGVVMGSYDLGPSDSRFEVYPVTAGPLVVSSVAGSKIVASLYELKRAGNLGEYNGQSEMMGLPSTALSDKYLIPIYFGMWGGYLDASLYIGVP